MTARWRLLVPTIIFTAVLAMAIVIIYLNAAATLREESHVRTAARVQSVARHFERAVAESRSMVEVMNQTQLVVDGVQVEDPAKVLDFIQPFPKQSLEILTVYDRSARILANASAPAVFGKSDELAPWLRAVMRGPAIESAVRTVDGRAAIVSAGAIRTINGVAGATVAGHFLDRRFARELTAQSGVDVVLMLHGSALATSLPDTALQGRYRATPVPLASSLASLAGLEIAIFEDTREDSGRYRISLYLVLAGVGIAGIFAILVSLSAMRSVARSEERLAFDATHDALTGLGNRRLFSTRLDESYARFTVNPDTDGFALAYIDLDYFKVINDSLGHEAGDKLLVEIARRISGCVRSEDVVVRLGGDEFAILINGIADRTDALRIVDRVLRDVEAPFELDRSRTVHTSASVGLAFAGPGYANAAEVLRDADSAAYRAKAGGRARRVIFNDDMLAQARHRLLIDTDLRIAIRRGQLRVVYQPVFELEGRSITGYEALVRWDHPQLRAIAPGDFIGVAEETGVIGELGRFVVRAVFGDIARLSQRGALPLAVSINIARAQVISIDFAQFVGSMLEEHGLHGSSIAFEFTESALVRGGGLASEALNRLKALGVKLYIDNFGTEDSSLSSLQRLAIDGFKIDASFVSGEHGGLRSERLVSSMTSLAQTFGIIAIAKGIETPVQAASLIELGCRYGQGFALAEPQDLAPTTSTPANDVST